MFESPPVYIGSPVLHYDEFHSARLGKLIEAVLLRRRLPFYP